LQNIVSFIGLFAKVTFNFEEPTNRSNPIFILQCHSVGKLESRSWDRFVMHPAAGCCAQIDPIKSKYSSISEVQSKTCRENGLSRNVNLICNSTFLPRKQRCGPHHNVLNLCDFCGRPFQCSDWLDNQNAQLQEISEARSPKVGSQTYTLPVLM